MAYALYPQEPLGESGRTGQAVRDAAGEQLIRIKIEVVSLDSTIIKVHPDGAGALKKTGRKPLANAGADGAPRFIWLPRMRSAP
jgi:hypothetical protein